MEQKKLVRELRIFAILCRLEEVSMERRLEVLSFKGRNLGKSIAKAGLNAAKASEAFKKLAVETKITAENMDKLIEAAKEADYQKHSYENGGPKKIRQGGNNRKKVKRKKRNKR